MPSVRIDWVRAIGFGLAVAVVGGLVWGLIAAATGYISTLVAIVIGYAVAWALVKGGGTVSVGMIVGGIVLTVFAVFIGDLVAFSIVGAEFGLTPLDIITNYPAIVALAPGETLGAYFFGFVGAAFSGYSLWQARKQALMPVPALAYPVPAYPVPAYPVPAYPVPAYPVPAYPVPAPAGMAPAANAPQARVLSRTMTDVMLEVTLPPPTHVIRAFYTTTTGRAEVHVDGQLATKTRVWGMKKEVHVPLGNGGSNLKVLFRGMQPHVDVFLDGELLATA